MIVRTRRNDAATLRLFCFSYAGGGASVFQTWSEHLPSWIEVCAIQLPGKETRIAEAPLTRLTDVTSELIRVLPPWFDRPFVFFGHSMGALVSFELTRRLRRNGLPQPGKLFVSAYSAPQLKRRRRVLHALPENEFIEELRLLDGTPEAVLNNRDLLDIFLPAIRADFEIHETYRYTTEDPLDCDISAFGGIEDAAVTPDELRAWKFQTHGQFTARLIRGGHFFVHSARSVLLSALLAGLEATVLPSRDYKERFLQ